jgi:hypothetical protein
MAQRFSTPHGVRFGGSGTLRSEPRLTCSVCMGRDHCKPGKPDVYDSITDVQNVGQIIAMTYVPL